MQKARTWDKIKQIFGAALEVEPAGRSAFLRQACGGDESLLAEVESLLAAHEDPANLSQNPWHDAFPLEMQVPAAIGPYWLVRKLGEGGMGEVWLAEQTAPVRRQVALKLIRSGIYSGSLLQRFKWERQSLAMMDHPAIAKVFEAGSTLAGQPYLVMEYVPGQPITDYCDEKKLTIRERLQLFILACEGVQHAHQKAIIHRDLKPANILVVEVDGQPTPRIIDFGLAKMTAPAADEQTLLETQAGSFLGTPGYISPEQAGGGTEDVDTRTDVYSLGVVLYVLLTGSLPFDTKTTPVHEFLRRLREQDPPKPSNRVAGEKETATSTASARATEPRHLRTLLTGDLDWIAMKALEKDRNRRYGAPSELAADIRRYLNNEPIAARPASTNYKLRKYVRRHWIGVAFGAAMVFLLVGFSVIQARQLRRITRERDRADRVSDFMTQMFKVSDPSEARGNSITAREILDRGSKEIETGLKTDPELRAQMMETMGGVYESLGLYNRGTELLKQTVALRREMLGANNVQTLRSEQQLGLALLQAGHYAEARNTEEEAVSTGSRVLQPDNPSLLRSRRALAEAISFLGHSAEAEKSLREVLAMQIRILGPENPDVLSTRYNLGTTLGMEAKFAEAEKFQRETLDIDRRVLGPEHPQTIIEMLALAFTLNAQYKDTQAEKLLRETLDDARRVLGPEHPDTLSAMVALGWTLAKEKQYPEAEKLQSNVVNISRRVLGAEHPDTLSAIASLGVTQMQEKKYTAADKALRQVMETERRILGPDHPEVAKTAYNLACVRAKVGDHDEALTLLRHAVDHGLNNLDMSLMGTDPDLADLQGDPRFTELASLAKSRAEAQGGSK
ncbi:MAG TPA: serine/threonine-protein kinase [Candidatus Angelobacter sp.]|nr:serine/threonine-protein kinase [Candidatus Angelobacter sp.]